VQSGILQTFDEIKEFQIAEDGNTVSDECEAIVIKLLELN
jgi:hypothetical protein